MSSLPKDVRDHFRNLGREYGRRLAEQEHQKSKVAQGHFQN
jgi:hypothetical protein